jgi:hypothetical protein
MLPVVQYAMVVQPARHSGPTLQRAQPPANFVASKRVL